MDQPILLPQERVIYSVAVGGPSGSPTAYADIGGVKLVPSEPPILVLNDRNGNHRAMVVLTTGHTINFTITETLKPVDLSVPGTLVNHDFTKLVH